MLCDLLAIPVSVYDMLVIYGIQETQLSFFYNLKMYICVIHCINILNTSIFNN